MLKIFLEILFGAVGGVYLALGRRNYDATWLVCGFLLLVYPYFFDSLPLILLIGSALCAAPIARDKGLF